MHGIAQKLLRAAKFCWRHALFALCVYVFIYVQWKVVAFLTKVPSRPPNMYIAIVGQALMVLGWAFVLRGWKRIAGLAAIFAVTGAMLLGDMMYYRQLADLPSVSSLKHADLLVGMDGMHGIVGEIFHLDDLWLFVGVPLILFLGLVSRWVRETGRLTRRNALVLSALGLALFVSVVMTTKRVQKPFGGKVVVAGRLGALGYHAHDAFVTAKRDLVGRFGDKDARIAQARTYFEKERSRQPAELAGAYEGYNVIYVQLESWQSFMLEKSVGGKEITPNLNRLIRESAYFPNFFAQVQQGTTSDAEFTSHCSLYAARTGAVYYDRAGTDFRCFPEVLRDHGYRTITMHGNRPDFWNRSAIYPAIGIDRFYDVRDFTMAQKIGMGIPDVEFLDQAVTKLQAEQKPFYSMLITLTSHNPFNYKGMPESGIEWGEFENTRIAHYLDSVHYTDSAVGVLLDRLEETGLLDKSILVVYGDHQGVARDNSNVGAFLELGEAEPAETFLLERKVPGMIRLPKGAHAGRYEKPAAQIDLSPTVARLVGIPVEQTPFLGRDLFSPQAGFVTMPNGSVITETKLFLSEDGGHGKAGCYAMPGLEPLPGDQCWDIEQKAQRELTVAWDMIESDVVGRVAESLSRDNGEKPGTILGAR